MKKTFTKLISLLAALSLVACVYIGEFKVNDIGNFYFVASDIVKTD